MKLRHPVCRLLSVGLPLAVLALGACSPKIYLADRQTVLEDEAAGEWPDFDQDVLRKTQAQSPTPFPTTAVSARRARLFNVLNGELVSTRASEGGERAEQVLPATRATQTAANRSAGAESVKQ